jgi:hypothetical protein
LRFISITLSDVGDIDDVVDIPPSFPNPNSNIFFIRFKTIGVEAEDEAKDEAVEGDEDIIGQA